MRRIFKLLKKNKRMEDLKVNADYQEIKSLLGKLSKQRPDRIKAFNEKMIEKIRDEMSGDKDAMDFINQLCDCALKRAAA